MRRVDIARNAPGLFEHGVFQRLRARFHRVRVAALARLDQALIVLQRELAVHRQPHRRTLVPPGQPHGELHALLRAGHDRHVLLVLRIRQRFGQNRAQPRLAPDAAGLHARKHALQIAHALRELAHLAYTPVHVFQLPVHQPERFAQPRFQRALHARAHRFELLLVLKAHDFQLFRHLAAHALLPRFHAVRHGGQVRRRAVHRAAQRVHRRAQLPAAAHHALVKPAKHRRRAPALPLQKRRKHH